MSKYNYEGPDQFQPLSPWAYFGYTILFAIPIIGFILLIVFSFSDKNINRRSFARSFFCGIIFSLILIAVTAVLGLLPDFNRIIRSLS